jgi:Skp family chaperone for outer membrane proteins
MKKFTILLLAVLLSAGVIATSAQTTKKIGMKRAKEIAAQQVQGKFKSSELEKEHGKWIYSFDILSKEGKIMEVEIDAYTGAVIATQEETPEKEAAEKAQEKAEKKKN